MGNGHVNIVTRFMNYSVCSLVKRRYRPSLLPLRLSQVSESEGEDEVADTVVELVRSPASSVKSPVERNGDADDDDVFLFDNNIPSIATRIPASAEPGDTLALRRRNRLLRLVSDARVYRSHGCLQRSVSDQLDERRRRHRHHGNDEDLLGTSWPPNRELGEHLAQNPDDIDDDDDDDDGEMDAEVARRRQDGRGGQNQRRRGAQNSRRSLVNGGGLRRKNVMSVDACCSGGSSSDATRSTKRRGTLRHGKVVVVADGEDLACSDDDDDDNAELLCHFCNGLGDQTKNSSSTPDQSNDNATSN